MRRNNKTEESAVVATATRDLHARRRSVALNFKATLVRPLYQCWSCELACTYPESSVILIRFLVLTSTTPCPALGLFCKGYGADSRYFYLAEPWWKAWRAVYRKGSVCIALSN